MGDSLPLPRGAAAALAADGARPLIFALTQPGALSPRDAYEATDGCCIFADRELVGAVKGRLTTIQLAACLCRELNGHVQLCARSDRLSGLRQTRAFTGCTGIYGRSTTML